MKNKIFALALTVCLLFAIAVPALAYTPYTTPCYVIDEADIFYDDDLTALNAAAAAVSNKYACSVMFYITEAETDSILGECSYLVEDCGLIYDNTLMLAISDNQYGIYSDGYIYNYITEADEDILISAYDEKDTYDEAVEAYISSADYVLSQYLNAVSIPEDSTVSTGGYITSDGSLFVDDQGLILSEDNHSEIEDKLQEVSDKYGVQVIIWTTDVLDETHDEATCDDFFDYNGYGIGTDRSGILLAFDAKDGLWYISTRGYGITAFTDAGIDYLFNMIRPSLKAQSYYTGFISFAEHCDEFIDSAKAGHPIDINDIPKDPFNWVKMIIIGLIIGLIVALIVVNKLKGELTSVRKQSAAGDYVIPGSLYITGGNDMFLYSNVTKTARSESSGSSGRSGGSSTHTSSSGASHGGHGGRL